MRAPMAVLTRDAILAELEAGRLRIDPFDADAVGPASIDLTLGDELRVIEPGSEPIPIREDADFRRYTRRIDFDGTFVLRARRDGPRHHARAHHARRRTSAASSRAAAASRASGS